jgi:hypothetical protein
MNNSKLPDRVFNSPCLEYANFSDGNHINLIRLIKPYANGNSFAIHNTTKSRFCSSGLFSSLERAKNKFDAMVILAHNESPLISQGKTNN